MSSITGFSFTSWIFPVVNNSRDESPLEKIIKNPSGFQNVIKLISNISLFYFGKGAFPFMQHRIDGTDRCIDSFGIFGDIKNLLDGNFKQDFNNNKKASLSSRCSFVIANITCSVWWVAEITKSELSLAAMSIGNFKIFGATPLKLLDKISLSFCLIGFVCMTADALGKIQNENPTMTWWQRFTESRPSSAWAGLAYSTTEIVLKTMIACSCASTTALGGVGIVAALLGLRFMLYPVAQDVARR